MTESFKIIIHRNSDNVHLKLVGAFDPDSAHKLLNTIEKHRSGSGKIFVHTSCLQSIHLSGKEAFLDRISMLPVDRSHLIFAGENANQIAPKECLVL